MSRALQDIGNSGGNALTSVNLSIASPGIVRQPALAWAPSHRHAPCLRPPMAARSRQIE
jgi:hypothetical protein